MFVLAGSSVDERIKILIQFSRRREALNVFDGRNDFIISIKYLYVAIPK